MGNSGIEIEAASDSGSDRAFIVISKNRKSGKYFARVACYCFTGNIEYDCDNFGVFFSYVSDFLRKLDSEKRFFPID